MLEVVILTVGLFVIVLTVGLFEYESSKEKQIQYKEGYNDCLLDVDEILADLIDKDIHSIGIETIRNRISLEYMED